jgi:tape measure domain-containing protein
MTSLDPISVEFFLRSINFKEEAARMKNELKGITGAAAQETKKTNDILATIGIGGAATMGLSKLKQKLEEIADKVIAVRGEYENAQIAFETMLGSKEKADELMQKIVAMAAKTPFSQKEIVDGTKQLLAYQENSKTVIDTMTRLGNIAAGLGVPLSRLILVYGQVKAKGKLMGDDLKQFTEVGIPLVNELAKSFGVTKAKVYELVSAGKVGFKDVQNVLENLTSKGGMFYNLMEMQSESLSGKVSNMHDAWDRLYIAIGKADAWKKAIGYITKVIDRITDLIEGVDELGRRSGYEHAENVLSNASATASENEAFDIITKRIGQLEKLREAEGQNLAQLEKKNKIIKWLPLLYNGYNKAIDESRYKLKSYNAELERLKNTLNDPQWFTNLKGDDETGDIDMPVFDATEYGKKLEALKKAYQQRDALIKNGYVKDAKSLYAELEQYGKSFLEYLQNEARKNYPQEGKKILFDYLIKELETQNNEFLKELDRILKNLDAIKEERIKKLTVTATGKNGFKGQNDIAGQLRQMAEAARKSSLQFNNLALKWRLFAANLSGDQLQKLSYNLFEAAIIAGMFNEELGIAVNFFGELSASAAKFATGDVIGGTLGTINALMSLQKQLETRAKQKEEEKAIKRQEYSNELISEANKLLEYQLELLDKIRGSLIYQGLIESQESFNKALDAAKKAIDELNLKNKESLYFKKGWAWEGATLTYRKRAKYKQYDFSDLNAIMEAAVNKPDYENISKAYKEIAKTRELIGNGTIFGDTKALEEQLQNYELLLQKAEEFAQKQSEILTGNTYDSIVDSLTSAFEDGVYSAEEFAGKFEDLMKNAVLNALKINYLKGPLSDFYGQFAKLSEGGLTKDEIAQLRTAYTAIAENASKAFEELKSITGIDFSSVTEDANSLSGAIKGMSEETASILAGQFNALRINSAEHLNVSRQALLHQAKTAQNTEDTVRMLALINNLMAQKLESIEQKLDNELRGKGL